MTVKELIAELQEFPSDHVVHCSVDCDPDGTLIAPEDHPRRVFGEDCMGVNPYLNQVVLLFNLESSTIEGVEPKKV